MEILLKLGHGFWYTVVPFILLLGVLVFVHELGHFLVARLCGVRVEVFSLGFGKKLLQYKRGTTNYCISLIPLGGYVKMFGEQPGDAISEELKSVSFTHKHVLKRMAIVLAGPIMNLLFAIFIFGVVALLGEEKRPAIIGDIPETSAAQLAGFKAGDVILKSNGIDVTNWEHFQTTLDEALGQKITLLVKSGDESPREIIAQVTPTENPNPLASSRISGQIEGLQFSSRGSHVAILDGSLLEAIGLQTGDRISSINGKEIRFWRELENQLSGISIGNQVAIVAERRDEKTEKVEALTINFVMPEFKTLMDLGIESPELYLAHVFPKSPAALAGLALGDRLIAINEVKLSQWDQVLNTIKGQSESSGPINVSVIRNGEEKKFSIEPKMTAHMLPSGKEEKRFTIGISPLISLAGEKPILVKAAGFIPMLSRGVEKSYDYTVMTLLSFVRLIQGEISPKNVGGVISIGTAASESFKAGTNYFLQMMGIISISLFVLNLLPIPVLDGGHLVFYSVELIKGSPMSLAKMELAQQVGLVLLMSLMLFALYNDFYRLFGFGTY
ncbi:MAG: RIP metalloprotease RseP [Bdellovibrionales bacterium]